MDYSLLIGLHFRDTSYNKDSLVAEACPAGVRTPRGSLSPIRQMPQIHAILARLNMCYNVCSGIGDNIVDSVDPRLSSVEMDQLQLDPTR